MLTSLFQRVLLVFFAKLVQSALHQIPRIQFHFLIVKCRIPRFCDSAEKNGSC